ncbi:MAG: hypothetical protein H6R06_389 [Proteobacteria bacterium]|jgi:hypothetical protein|nr:hypothetical protein [Pseudomonadota bacterium]
MRASASLIAAMAVALVGVQAAHAQSSDKPQPAATAKTQSATKSTTAQARPAAPTAQARSGTDAGKAKIEGVSTMRSTPADRKKDGGCSHSMADDA